ncbi:MAG: hypothetical protein JWM59_2171 [Verrucomicrobiales bacterium]|nr:hypothetical protein [Verrucomicrobiales bacterium]
MLKIALIQKKGGVGKTTLTVLLREAIQKTGQAVAIRDYDSQGSASKVLEKLGGIKETPGQIYSILLIDTPPSLILPATAAAVKDADIILIPTSPSPVDIWEADEAARFVASRNSKALVRIVLNRTKSGTLLTDAAGENLSGLSVPVLPVSLADRQSYQHALLGGWNALDSKAQKELLQFTVAVTSLR